MSNAQDKKDDNKHDKTLTIIVNGRKKEVREAKLTFEQIVALAFPNPETGPNIAYTVTYRGGERPKPEGTLSAGDSIKIKDGMIFNVTKTDKS